MKNLLKNSLLTFMFLFSVMFFGITSNAADVLSFDSDTVAIKENGTRIVQITDSASTTTKSFTFKSKDTSIATVEKYAADSIKITAKNYGSTTVTVTSADGTTTKDIAVNVYVGSFTVDDMTVAVGKVATITPKFATGYTYNINNMTFVSNNKQILTTNGNKITGVKAGETTVTASVIKAQNDGATEDVEVTFTVTVIQPVESIEIAKTDVTVNSGDSFSIGATVKPDTATVKDLSYTSNNENVKVDKTGKVTTTKGKDGTAVITVSSTDGSNITKKVNVTVVNPVTELNVTSDTIKDYAGQKVGVPIFAEVNKDATDKTITYKSANEKVATVDSKGYVTLTGVGNTVITVSAGNIKKEVKIVSQGEITELSAAKEITVEAGSSITLPFTVKAENNDDYLSLIKDSVDVNSVIAIDNFGNAKKTTAGGEYIIRGVNKGFVIFTLTAKNPSGKELTAVVKVIVTEKPQTTTEEQKTEEQVQTINVDKAVISKITVGKKCITVKTKALTGVTGYEIQIATNKKFTKGKKSTTSTKTSKKIKKLKKGKKYYVRVRGYVLNSDNTMTFGEWSKVKISKKVK